MTEPRPLLEENATDLEKALLRAGRAEVPDERASAHLLGMLQGLPGPTLPGPVAGPVAGPVVVAAKSASVAAWAKLGVLALALGGGAITTHHLVRPRAVPPRANPAVPTVARPVPAIPSDEPLPPPALETPRESPPRPKNRLHHAGPAKPPAEMLPIPPDHSLAGETGALDHARESLEAQRFAEALRLLDEYQQKYPQGRLRTEATVLRLSALVKSGQRGAAQALADRLLADEEYRTYARRIRSLMREARAGDL